MSAPRRAGIVALEPAGRKPAGSGVIRERMLRGQRHHLLRIGRSLYQLVGRAQIAARLAPDVEFVGGVGREAERQVRLLVALAWRHGWQPMEVAREVRRSANAP